MPYTHTHAHTVQTAWKKQCPGPAAPGVIFLIRVMAGRRACRPLAYRGFNSNSSNDNNSDDDGDDNNNKHNNSGDDGGGGDEDDVYEDDLKH